MRKVAFILALAMTVTPVAEYALAGMQQGAQRQCKGDATCIREKAEDDTAARAESGFRFVADKIDGAALLIKESCYIGPVAPINYRHKDISGTYPAADCERIVSALFADLMAVQAERAKAGQEANDQRDRASQENEHKAALDRQKEEALGVDLRSGKIKPTNIRQAIVAYSAKHGGDLASAPKIRPDGGMYFIHGKIQQAGDRADFIASLSASQENDAIAEALRRSRRMGESTDYFKVTIPKSLQQYYFDQAKIGGGFDLVGRYASNIAYKTVSGQEKSAPVFEAVYFVMW